MQLTLLVSSFLASLAIAAPAGAAPQTITISIANDFTGRNAAVTVPGDGIARNIPDLFRGSAIDQNGAIVGSSAQLTKFTDQTKCFFQNGNQVINLNGRDKTFVDLDGNPSASVPVYLNGFNLQCS